ncbi:MAG: ECF transporter S component [Clostridia bacterium]|nr:ECF transporter S component [Clostridia bacterium]
MMSEKTLLHRSLDQSSRQDQTLRLVQLAMLTAISSILVFVCFPIVPGAPFLKYDMADVPVLLAAFTMGTPAGMIVLLAASAIQAFLFGHDGPIGFLMHVIASGTLVLVAVSLWKALKKRRGSMIIALVCGSLAMALIMIPLNFIFTPKVLMDVPVGEAARLFWDGLSQGYDPAGYSAAAVNAYNAVKGLLLVGLIPFNLIKAGLNSLILYFVYHRLAHLIRKRAA